MVQRLKSPGEHGRCAGRPTARRLRSRRPPAPAPWPRTARRSLRSPSATSSPAPTPAGRPTAGTSLSPMPTRSAAPVFDAATGAEVLRTAGAPTCLRLLAGSEAALRLGRPRRGGPVRRHQRWPTRAPARVHVRPAGLILASRACFSRAARPSNLHRPSGPSTTTATASTPPPLTAGPCSSSASAARVSAAARWPSPLSAPAVPVSLREGIEPQPCCIVGPGLRRRPDADSPCPFLMLIAVAGCSTEGGDYHRCAVIDARRPRVRGTHERSIGDRDQCLEGHHRHNGRAAGRRQGLEVTAGGLRRFVCHQLPRWRRPA